MTKIIAVMLDTDDDGKTSVNYVMGEGVTLPLALMAAQAMRGDLQNKVMEAEVARRVAAAQAEQAEDEG